MRSSMVFSPSLPQCGAAGRQQQWRAMLVEDVIGILVAGLAFFWPGLTVLALLYLIAYMEHSYRYL